MNNTIVTARLILLALAITAAIVSQSAARPLREMREVLDSAVNITDVQLQLKLSVNALSMITRPSSLVSLVKLLQV